MGDEINLFQSATFQQSYYFSYKHFNVAVSYLQNNVHLQTLHMLKLELSTLFLGSALASYRETILC